MSLSGVDLLFNMVVALFWIRAWESRRRPVLFNPYLDGVENFTQPLLDFMMRGGLVRSQSAAAWVGLGLLLVFRGVALPLTNPETIRQVWRVRFGFEVLAPAHYDWWPPAAFLVFSALSFGVFVFQVWGLAFLFTGRRDVERPAEFLQALSGPLAGLSWQWRAWVLSVYGLLLTGILNLAATNILLEPSRGVQPVLWLLRGLVLVLAGLVDLLAVLQSMMIILIMGSWIALFTGGGALAVITREWLDFFLGPFRRFPVRVGFLDLTPILAFFALGVVHFLLNGFLLQQLYLLIRGMGG